MRVDLRDTAAPGISAPVAGVGTAVTVGLLELARAALAERATPHDLQSAALLVLAVYGALGLAAGIACWMVRRVPAAPAAVLGLLAAIAAGASETRPILHVSALALGGVVFWLLARAFARYRGLPRARLAASAALVSLSGVSALAARALPAYGPRWALGAAVAALGGAVLVWTPRVRASALLLAAGAVYLLAQGAHHFQRLAPLLKPAPNAPSVLLVTIDTLRADRVGAYGYAAARTKNLDALAAEGFRFENAFSHALFTGPSHASILSGRSPLSTKFVIHDGRGLDPAVETLAEAFARAGYVTAAFPSSTTTSERITHLPSRFQYANEDLREHTRFPQFVYRCVAIRPLEARLTGPRTWPPYRPAHATTNLAVQFLGVHTAAPTFTWVHYFDPHLPYAPPAEYRPKNLPAVPTDWYALRKQERAAIAANPAQVATLRALYDAEIAYVDHELGRLIAAARAAAPPGGLMIVVTADHGEPMGEHGHFWFRDLHDETLHVPLVMVPPPRVVFSPRVVHEQVRLIDVAPTILEWAGLPKLAHADGVSLAKLAAGDAANVAPPPLVAVWEPHASEATSPAFAVRRLDWKLIESEPGFWATDRWFPGTRELFAVGTDPGEQVNVAASHPAELEELLKLLPADFRLVESPPIDPKLREDLRALGYMQ